MLSLKIFNGRGGLSEAEIAMATPDEAEAKDLSHHTQRCAKRFRLLAEGQNDLHATTNELKWIVIVGVGYLVLVSQPAQNAITILLKFIGG